MTDRPSTETTHSVLVKPGTTCPSCGLEKLKNHDRHVGFCPNCKFQFIFNPAPSQQDPRVVHPPFSSPRDPRVVNAPPQHTMFLHKQEILAEHPEHKHTSEHPEHKHNFPIKDQEEEA